MVVTHDSDQLVPSRKRRRWLLTSRRPGVEVGWLLTKRWLKQRDVSLDHPSLRFGVASMSVEAGIHRQIQRMRNVQAVWLVDSLFSNSVV